MLDSGAELNVATRNFFGVPLGVYFSPSCVKREPFYTVFDKGSIDAVTAYFSSVAALQAPHNSIWTEMLNIPDMQYFFNSFIR